MKTVDRAVGISMYQKALEQVSKGDYAGARCLLEQVVEYFGGWERGNAHHSLGGCYEELGEFEKARQAYLVAQRQEPGNPYFVDTYAAFLRLHGSEREFYDWELASIQLALEHGNAVSDERKATLTTAGEKLGVRKEETESRLKERFSLPQT